MALLLTDGVTKGYAAQISFTNYTLNYTAAGNNSLVTATVYNQLGAVVSGVPVAFQIGYGDLGIPAEFNWSFDYTKWKYKGDGLATNALGGGSIGGSFQGSANQSKKGNASWGVENMVNDAEVLGPGPLGIDSCDPSTYLPGFGGLYYINVTSKTNVLGQLSAEFTALPMPKDSDLQVMAYVGGPTGTLTNVVDACNFVSHFAGIGFRIDSGVVIQRAPGFALGSITSNAPIFTSDALTRTFTAKFYTLGGTPAADLQVFAVRGQGSATRNVLGTYGGTMTTNATGVLKFSNSVPYLGASQGYYYSLLPADPAYAFGGREQLFGGALGDFWFGPTFEVLIAKFPYAWQMGYMWVPSGVLFATASAVQPIIPLGGTTQVLVHVQTGGGLPSSPVDVGGAQVWSGAYLNATDSSGDALVTFVAPAGASGAIEGLVVATNPTTGATGVAWFGVMVTGPVLTYGAISATMGAAGSTSTFTTTVTNTVPVGGTATVNLVVNNATVGTQVITIGPSGSQSVSFSYVFASAGNYAVSIGTQNYAASVGAAQPTGFSPEALTLSIVLLVVGLVVGVLVGIMMSRRGKKPAPAMPEETETPGEKPAEEELPTEDKL